MKIEVEIVVVTEEDNFEVTANKKSLYGIFCLYRMMIMKNIFLIVFGILLVLVLLKLGSRVQRDNSNFGKLEIVGKVLDVEVVDTDNDRQVGLSGRLALPRDGMLFIFQTPSKYSFWMKDMSFPIDIIWFDKDWQVVYVVERASPSSYPERFAPSMDAQFVLEVESGFASSTQIKIGTQAKFTK